jgi:alanyl-tRNA synthetase
MSIEQSFKEYCQSFNIPFQLDKNVKSYNDSTLFCPAGMQQFTEQFKDENYIGTLANVQSCIRMNDFDEINDSTHLLYFDMLGLFSFRDWSIKKAIDFWIGFINKLGLKLSYVTIHPDKYEEWKDYYKEYNIVIKKDQECTWSDVGNWSYCTEFYINDIEIGNIVNPYGTSIDAGFGKDRLDMILYNIRYTKIEILKNTIEK